MIFRPAVASDLDRLFSLITPDPACTMTAAGYRAKAADRQYRPEWTWLAEDDASGDLLAVAVWWGFSRESTPGALDGFFVHDSLVGHDARTGLAAELLTAAHAAYARAGLSEPPAYHVFLPGDWRGRPDVLGSLTWRQEAVALAGLPVAVERLRYTWTPETGLPEPSGRVLFRPEQDDEVFVGLFRRVLEGTLDAASRAEAELTGAESQARGDVEFYRDAMLGDRSWWRTAHTPDGETIGFGIPSRNQTAPVVGYLGVLPEHRGHGYADDVLAEITRILGHVPGTEQVLADTDLTNVPMAAAFERAGYRNLARRLVFSAR